MKSVYSISLKFWLPIFTIAIYLVLSVFSFWLNYQNQRSEMITQNKRFIQQDIAALIREMENNFAFQGPLAAKNSLLSRGVNQHYESLVTIDPKGFIIYSTRSTLVGKKAHLVEEHFREEENRKALAEKKIRIIFDSERGHLTLYAPLKLDRISGEIRSLRTGSVFLDYSLEQEFNHLLDRVVRQSLAIVIFFAILTVIFVTFIYLYIGKPAKHLLDVTEAFSANQFVERTDISGDGEFAKLGSAFNEMADELIVRLNLQQEAQSRALWNKQVLDSVFNSIPDLFFLMDKDHLILDFRTGNRSSLFVKPESFLGKSMLDVLPAEIAELFSSATKGLKEKNNITTFEYGLKVSEEFRQFEARLSLLDDEKSFIAVVRDITNKKAAEEKITHQAYFDSLTDLPNRTLMLDRLEQLLLETRRLESYVGILFLDLDDFKLVNDSLGHETGDRLLIDAAKRLRKCVRKEDTVSRLGGDEFIILINNLAEKEDVISIIETIMKEFKRAFTIDERDLMVSASIGVSIFPGDGDNTSDLLRNADSAMYHAKAAGRNCYSFYTDSMNQEISRRLAVEELLHGALERNEFEVYYQPQFEMKSGKLIGAEALLRWTTSKLGSVSPAEFIPIAEQTGAILSIGEFVLTEALEMTKDYSKNFKDFRIAVNLSPRQFRDPNLVLFVQSKLDEMGVNPNQLELEITEGVLLGRNESIQQTLTELHNKGIWISMDDFGTGYSSLSYLRKYPFDILKIDRTFVNDITRTDNGSELIKAMVGMSHGLKMKVIAEGVETEEQFQLLKQVGCDSAQGFLLGKPMPRKKFERIERLLDLEPGSAFK